MSEKKVEKFEVEGAGVNVPDQEKGGYNGFSHGYSPAKVVPKELSPEAKAMREEALALKKAGYTDKDIILSRWFGRLRSPVKIAAAGTLAAIAALLIGRTNPDYLERERANANAAQLSGAESARLESAKGTGLSAIELSCSKIPEGMQCSPDAISRGTLSGVECCYQSGLKHPEDPTTPAPEEGTSESAAR